MFEQITKAFQDASAGPVIRSAQEAQQKAQQKLAKAAADVTEFAQIELSNALALAQAVKPEQAVQALVKAAQDRQAFIARKTKETFDEMGTLGAAWGKQAEAKGAEFAQQANASVDAAFNTVKQGVGMAESAAKSVVAKATKSRKA